MAELKETALTDAHRKRNARMASFGGYLMPIQYTGIIAEHTATRTGAGLFDTCHMGEFLLRGKNAVPSAESLLSCNVSGLKQGRCRYGYLCNENGGVIDDLLVYRMAEDELMLVVNAGTRKTDLGWIQEHLLPDTTIEDISDQTAKIDVQGPGSPTIINALLEDPVRDLKFYRFRSNRFQGEDILLSRTGYTGEIGFEIYCRNDMANAFWQSCIDKGAVPAGLGARDTLRLESGLPLYGHELSDDRNAADAGFPRALSESKNFIGCEAVRRPRMEKSKLVGIEMDGRKAARQGDEISDEAGRIVGAVTSGSFAPSLGKAVAMAYVDAAGFDANASVGVRKRRDTIPGRVVSLPFYKDGTARKPLEEFL